MVHLIFENCFFLVWMVPERRFPISRPLISFWCFDDSDIVYIFKFIMQIRNNFIVIIGKNVYFYGWCWWDVRQ